MYQILDKKFYRIFVDNKALEKKGVYVMTYSEYGLSFYERKFADAVVSMYPNYTDKAIAKKIGTSAKTVNKIAKKLSLKKPKQSEMLPDELQKNFILKNSDMSCKKLSEHLGVPRQVVTRWVRELIPKDADRNTFKTSAELREHYYNLCLWYLRGFSVDNIVMSYEGRITDEEVRKALTYDKGKIFKKCYFKIKFAGNDVCVNDDSALGVILKERVRRWDEYLSEFEVKAV